MCIKGAVSPFLPSVLTVVCPGFPVGKTTNVTRTGSVRGETRILINGMEVLLLEIVPRVYTSVFLLIKAKYIDLKVLLSRGDVGYNNRLIV